MDHSKMQMPMPAEPTTQAKQKAGEKPASSTHAGHQTTSAPASTAEPKPPTETDLSAMDHSAMGHAMPMPANQQEPVDHSAMQHDMSSLPSEATPVETGRPACRARGGQSV